MSLQRDSHQSSHPSSDGWFTLRKESTADNICSAFAIFGDAGSTAPSDDTHTSPQSARRSAETSVKHDGFILWNGTQSSGSWQVEQCAQLACMLITSSATGKHSIYTRSTASSNHIMTYEALLPAPFAFHNDYPCQHDENCMTRS